MEKRKIKKTFLIPLFLGIALIIAGIVMTVTFATKGLFETIFVGPLVLFFGFFVTVFVTIIVFAVSNNQKPEENITDTEFYDNLQDFAKKIKKLNQKQCKYCGSTIDTKETECPNCGAKNID